MKRACVGFLCGALSLLAVGCNEVGSSSGGQVGNLEGDDKPAATDSSAQSTEPKVEASRDTGKSTDPTANKAAAEDPTLKPDVADGKTLSAPDQRAAAEAAKNRHIGPQLIATGGDGRARNITFDTIKFPMDDPKSRMFKREMLSPSIEQLNGKKIRIRGYILPGALTEFTHFVFVRDNQECCFGPGAAIYDSMMVDMDESSGSATQVVEFTTRPVTVEGTFTVKELIGPDDKHWSIYHITADKVE